MQRKGSAVWNGGFKEGSGTITTETGLLNAKYSLTSRFENGMGTNPEELLAAAHAGCFSMALSAELGKVNLKPTKIETKATITLEKSGDGYSITESHLDLIANIPGADKTIFDAAVKAAETGCPVSKLYKTKITVSSKLES